MTRPECLCRSCPGPDRANRRRSSSSRRTAANRTPASTRIPAPGPTTSKRPLVPPDVTFLLTATRMACIPGGGHGLNPRADTGPSLVELVGDVDDLRLLRLRRFDFLADVLGDEAADLAVDAGHDAQQLATEACRRHVDGDVRRPWLGDVDDQQQRFGRARCRGQRDVTVDLEPLFVEA